MKNFVKAMAVVCSLALVACCFAGCGAGAKNYTSGNTTFVIGASGPLTGGAGVYGQGVKNGAQMAVDEINEKGGLNGVKFSLEMMDDKNDASNVSVNFSTLLEKGMQVSLGCVTTNPCLEFKNLSKDENVFFITPSASNDKVPEYDNAYQMCFADGTRVKPLPSM